MALNLDGTYAGLKIAVASFLDRTDSQVYVDDLIKIGEDRIYEEVLSPDMITACSAAISSGVLALPSNYIGIKQVSLVDTYEYPLESMSLDQLFTFYPQRSSDGRPEAYAVNVTSGGSYYLEFGPYPSSNYVVKAKVYARQTDSISTTVSGNTFFTRNQKLFLFAALAESGMRLGQDSRVPIWEKKYADARAAVLKAAEQKDFGGPLRIRAG